MEDRQYSKKAAKLQFFAILLSCITSKRWTDSGYPLAMKRSGEEYFLYTLPIVLCKLESLTGKYRNLLKDCLAPKPKNLEKCRIYSCCGIGWKQKFRQPTYGTFMGVKTVKWKECSLCLFHTVFSPLRKIREIQNVFLLWNKVKKNSF